MIRIPWITPDNSACGAHGGARPPVMRQWLSAVPVCVCIQLLLFASGCGTIGGLQLAGAEKKLRESDAYLQEESKVLTTAILDVSKFGITQWNGVSNALLPSLQVISLLAEEDQRLEGLPVARRDAGVLVSSYLKKRDTFLDDEVKENTEQLEENRALTSEVNYLKEKTDILSQFGRSVKTTLIVIALIVGVLFFSPWILGALTRVFPALIGVSNVVGKKTMDQVVKGIEATRKQLTTDAAEDPTKTYTAKQVLELFSQNNDVNQDDMTRRIVKRRK